MRCSCYCRHCRPWPWERRKPRPAATRSKFCLHGEFDLGVRLQGMRPEPGEASTATWCVTTEDDSPRVHFRASGRSNPDIVGTFALSYIPPETVRIVNREAPPDVEFAGADIAAEAGRNRRIDPHRLVEELATNPGWVVAEGEDGWRRVRYPGSATESRAAHRRWSAARAPHDRRLAVAGLGARAMALGLAPEWRAHAGARGGRRGGIQGPRYEARAARRGGRRSVVPQRRAATA